jgi:hypothetical protein
MPQYPRRLRSALLYTWEVGTDPWNNGHYPISIKYNGMIEVGKCSKKASRLCNKNTDWAAFMEKVKLKTEVKTHNGGDRERDGKERFEKCIQTNKGKLEENTPKRRNKNNLGNGGQGRIRNKEKQPECVRWNRNCEKVIGIIKAKLLK